jgi:hypothetical protein
VQQVLPVCRKDIHVCQHRCTACLTAPHNGFGGCLTTACIKQLCCRKHPLLPISAHVALHTFTAFPCCSASLNTSSALLCGPSPPCTATAAAAEPASLRLPLSDGADETLLVCLPERPFSALAKLPDALVNTLMGQAGAGHGCSTQELQSVVVEVILHVEGGRRCHGTTGCTAPCQQRTCTVTLQTILQYGRQSPCQQR